MADMSDPAHPSRFNRYRREVNALYRHGLRAWREVKSNPVAKIDRRKRKKSRVSYIPTAQELAKVLEYARKKGEKTGRWQQYNLLIAYRDTWGRKNEILKWTWKDHINWDAKKVRLVNGKPSYEMADVWFPMSPDLEEALSWQRETSVGGKYVFENRAWAFKNKRDRKGRSLYGGRIKDGSQLITGICKEAGVTPFNFHAIRHNRITEALEEGKAIHNVKRAARHHNIAVTSNYAHSRKELEETLW